MTFDALLAQILELLQREQRLSYRALKRRFDLDDAYLDDLKAEIIDAKRLAVDEDGKVLVWTGAAVPSQRPAPPSEREAVHVPLAYPPPYLTEKILTAPPPWKASVSRSPCSSLISKARRN